MALTEARIHAKKLRHELDRKHARKARRCHRTTGGKRYLRMKLDAQERQAEVERQNKAIEAQAAKTKAIVKTAPAPRPTGFMGRMLARLRGRG